jgi:hypothetical protein
MHQGIVVWLGRHLGLHHRSEPLRLLARHLACSLQHLDRVFYIIICVLQEFPKLWRLDKGVVVLLCRHFELPHRGEPLRLLARHLACSLQHLDRVSNIIICVLQEFQKLHKGIALLLCRHLGLPHRGEPLRLLAWHLTCALQHLDRVSNIFICVNRTSKNYADCFVVLLCCHLGISRRCEPLQLLARHFTCSIHPLDRASKIIICVYRASKDYAECTRLSLYCFVAISGFPAMVKLSTCLTAISPVPLDRVSKILI